MGLILYAWVIMTNHVHLIIGTNKNPMQNILRDFKSFASRKLKEELTNYHGESRKGWMLWMFERAGQKNGNNGDWHPESFRDWQQHNHPIELFNNKIIDQKLNYIHQNPVKAGHVQQAEDWTWSSAADYAGEKGDIIGVGFLD